MKLRATANPPDRPHPAAHDVFVSRQPILDRRRRTYGYELLFRSSLENICGPVDETEAARQTLHAAWLDLGVGALVGRKRAFVNVTRDLLVSGTVLALPAESTVIEVLETVEPEDVVITACRELKDRGYMLALDDFVYRPELRPLVQLVDIIKVEFSEPDAATQCDHLRQFARPTLQLLAEKVETQDTFKQAKQLGCTLFQGWFFCRPEVVAGRSLTGVRMTAFALLQALSSQDYDIKQVVEIVQRDVAVSHRLLKYLGSAAFPWRKPVRSIRHALMLLGERGARRWACLTALDEMAVGKPHELLLQAAIRGRFCEQVADAVSLRDRSSDLFLLGAFSLIDTMLDQPMSKVLAQLPLGPDLKDALMGKANPLRRVLDLAEVYEQARWLEVLRACREFDITDGAIAPVYRSAVEWATQAFAA